MKDVFVKQFEIKTSGLSKGQRFVVFMTAFSNSVLSAMSI